MPNEPDKLDQETLAAIKSFMDQNGYPPSLVELGNKLGLSDVAAFNRLNRLERNGFITRDTGKARGLRLVDPGIEYSVGEPA